MRFVFSYSVLDSYIKADDPSNFLEVIQVAKNTEKYDELIKFLQMARKTVRQPIVESELVYAFAKTSRLADLEEFISAPNIVEVREIKPVHNLFNITNFIDGLDSKCWRKMLY
jgi:hypothetical protein